MNTLHPLRFLLVLCAALAAPAFAAEPTLLDFELEDHRETQHHAAEWQGKPVVLFVSAREGQVHNEGYVWSAPIVEALAARGDAIAIARVANVPGMPRFVRGMVRGMVEDAGNPVPLVLIDWNGSFAQAYGLQPDAYHVLVFDAGHQLVFSEALRAFDEARLAAILVRLELVKSTTIQPQ